jgi:hypothetical protein
MAHQAEGNVLMDDSNLRGAYIALFGGILMFIMAVGGTFTGKLPGRWGGVGTRRNSPGQYWTALIGYYLGAIAFIGYFFYKVHSFSN